MAHTLLRRVLLAMSVATVLLLFWNQFGMDKRRVIDGSSQLPVVVRDDQRANAGKSTGWLEQHGSKLILHCDIREGYKYPYCLMSLRLGAAPQGVDLSGYDRLIVSLNARGPEPQQQVRFAVRDFNPRYSRPGDEESLKNQEVIFSLDNNQPLEVRLSQLSVASWWVEEHRLPLQYGGLEYDNVIAIDVTTASEVLPGPHIVTVERIELRGKWITPAQLRLCVIVVWLLAVFVYLVADSLAARRELAASRLHGETLREINEALRLESVAHASLARKDALTGLLNRKGLSDALQARAQPEKALFPVSLIFLDIDHFKLINDQHGHAVGDKVLRGVARCLMANTQRSDLLTRWGGEEFLLVCPHGTLTEAINIADRLRALIEAHDWPQDLAVTCSFGVAEASASRELRDGIDRADRAMYAAKRAGRNRVCVGEAQPADTEAQESVPAGSKDAA